MQLQSQYPSDNPHHQLAEDPQSQDQKLQTSQSNSRINSFPSLLLIIINISLSPLYFGYILAYLSSIDFNTIMKVYSITLSKDVAEGFLIGCLPVGGAIGAIASNYLLDKYSRRNSILWVNAVALIAGIIVYYPTMQVLFLARFTQGICAGLYSSIAPLIMKELSPNQLSGTLTSCNQIFIAFGVFFAFVFSAILSAMYSDDTGQNTWHIIFGFPLVILIVQSYLLTHVYNYETPKYLLQKNLEQKAIQLISVIYKAQYVSSVLIQLKNNLNRSSSSQSSLSITPRAAIIAAIHLSALQQFSGINAVIAYGSQMVGQSSSNMKHWLPILINLEQVLASLFTSYLIMKVGRKKLLEVGSVGASIAGFIIAMGFASKAINQMLSLGLIVLGLVVFMANFGLTLGPVVWVYLPEIAQPKILSYATMVNWLTSAFIMFLFPMIKQKLPNKNPALLFVFFAVYCLISYFVNKNILIETMNKGEKQINEQFQKKVSIC